MPTKEAADALELVAAGEADVAVPVPVPLLIVGAGTPPAELA